ncbi:MAG: UPF0758 domain-containing protein [Fodinibius sp.]|nr:UPF0758 domain-containing protein [Fodinibius sp.]
MSDEETFEADDFIKRTVKEMNPDEQPREKLTNYGSESLSDAELLAILLRTGSRKMNVIQMAQALLDHFDGLRYLARKEWQDLKVIPGMGKVKSLTLEAVFELSRRIQMASLGEQVQITSPERCRCLFRSQTARSHQRSLYGGVSQQRQNCDGL